MPNAAVRLVCSLPRREFITSSFICLHWLPIKFRINFKIAMLCFKYIHGHAPNYLKSMVAIKKTSWKTIPDDRKKSLAIGPFPMHSPRFGTVSHNHFSHSKNFNTFKSLLKTHYFREAFNLQLLFSVSYSIHLRILL